MHKTFSILGGSKGFLTSWMFCTCLFKVFLKKVWGRHPCTMVCSRGVCKILVWIPFCGDIFLQSPFLNLRFHAGRLRQYNVQRDSLQLSFWSYFQEIWDLLSKNTNKTVGISTFLMKKSDHPISYNGWVCQPNHLSH